MLYNMNCAIYFGFVCDGLNAQSREAHEGHRHEADGDERDAESLKGLGHVGVGHLFVDGSEGHDGQQPAQSGAKGVDDGVADARYQIS